MAKALLLMLILATTGGCHLGRAIEQDFHAGRQKLGHLIANAGESPSPAGLNDPYDDYDY